MSEFDYQHQIAVERDLHEIVILLRNIDRVLSKEFDGFTFTTTTPPSIGDNN